jgi:hypothetical protein
VNSSEVGWPDPDGLIEVAFDGGGMASGVVSDFVWTVLISEFISKPPEITSDGPLPQATTPPVSFRMEPPHIPGVVSYPRASPG